MASGGGDGRGRRGGREGRKRREDAALEASVERTREFFFLPAEVLYCTNGGINLDRGKTIGRCKIFPLTWTPLASAKIARLDKSKE